MTKGICCVLTWAPSSQVTNASAPQERLRFSSWMAHQYLSVDLQRIFIPREIDCTADSSCQGNLSCSLHTSEK